MKKNKQLQVSNDQTESRAFKYAKGDVNLSFTLRTDIVTELKDFKEVLEVALVDVSKIISDKKN